MKYVIAVALFLIMAQSYAQDVFKENLYSADLVMSNRSLIGLTDKQADKIKAIHSAEAGNFRSLKWDLDDANAQLKTMLATTKVDEAAVEKQLERILSLENQLKKKQFKTLVAIKNELTESQQAELNILNKVPQSTTSMRGVVVEGTKKSAVQTSKSTVYIASANENQLLYVVRFGGKEKKVSSIEGLDPSNINSVSVIKGSSAWELYGDEGKHGVVIVELKKEAKFNFE